MSLFKWGAAALALVTVVAVASGGKKKKKTIPSQAPASQGPIHQVRLSDADRQMFADIENTSSIFVNDAGAYQNDSATAATLSGAGAAAAAAQVARQAELLTDMSDVLVGFYIDLKDSMKKELTPLEGG